MNVSWSTASPTVWEIHFRYRNWHKYHLKRGNLFFKLLFVPMNSEMEPARPTMLRHQAAENSLITFGAAKKELFSSKVNFSCWILKQFERTSYFLGIQAWVFRQNEKQKNYAQKSGQRGTFSILIFFFIISQNACLIFFKTAFELLLYWKWEKRFEPFS